MLLTLLGIGAYTTYKLMDNESRKIRFDKLMVDFDPSNDAHIEEFLSILKSSKEKIIGYDEYKMKDFLYYAEKELKTIPYLTEDDLKQVKQKLWRIKAEHYIKNRERTFKSATKGMKEDETTFKNKPTNRRVYQKRKIYINPDDLEKLKNTFFGKLVYFPNGGRFYSATDYYYIFVVDVPEGAILDLIFNNSLNYVRYSEPSSKEMNAIRNAGMYNEIFGEK